MAFCLSFSSFLYHTCCFQCPIATLKDIFLERLLSWVLYIYILRKSFLQLFCNTFCYLFIWDHLQTSMARKFSVHSEMTNCNCNYVFYLLLIISFFLKFVFFPGTGNTWWYLLTADVVSSWWKFYNIEKIILSYFIRNSTSFHFHTIILTRMKLKNQKTVKFKMCLNFFLLVLRT